MLFDFILLKKRLRALASGSMMKILVINTNDKLR